MSTLKLALTLSAVAIAAAVVWWNFQDGTPSTAGPSTALAAPPPAAELSVPSDKAVSEPVPPPRVADANSKRNAVATPAAEKEPAPPVAEKLPLIGAVDVRFVDEHGAPWSDVRVTARGPSWLTKWNPKEETRSGADGRAKLELALPEQRVSYTLGDNLARDEVRVDFIGSRKGCASVASSATLRAGETTHLGDVVLPAGVRVDGRVVDENGAGIVGATVGVAAAELTEPEGYLRRHGCEQFELATSVKTGEGGAFALDGVALGPHRLWAHAKDMRYSWTPPFSPERDAAVHGIELVLTPLLATDRIAGRVVGPDGEPIASADVRYSVHAGDKSHSTSMVADEQGEFVLLLDYDGSTCDFTARDKDDRFGPRTIEGVQPGTLDLELRLSEQRLLTLRLRDPDGGPVEGAKLMLQQNNFGAETPAKLRAPGDYDISIPDDKFHLDIEAKGFRREHRKLVGAAQPAVLDVVLRRAPLVRGRVQAGGAPLAGVLIQVARDDPSATATVDGFRYRYFGKWGTSTTTGADGRFEVACDLDGEFWLRATAKGWATGELGPIAMAEITAERSFDVELTHGGAIEGHVLLPDGKDGEGAIVAINHGDGDPRTLRADSKGFFRFEGLAPGTWQVLSREQELEPGSHSYAGMRNAPPIEWSCEVTAGRTTTFNLDLTRK
ncbi:MAG TPA: carboxypeptidase-like regulatory domain-containing protein [Planctomycetota bacterium]|nr:carboxypeptidase-like regulatory domain-containing protein [Planctomycetota bacterium]